MRRLAELGHHVVEEAATAVIAQAHTRGVDEPWRRPFFVDEIVALQRRRQLAASAAVQVYDRSPVCTLALAAHLGLPVTRALRAELARIATEGVYERRVFFVRNLGLCEPTPARRISFEESLAFERLHEETYRDLGYELVEVPAADLARRVAVIDAAIASHTP
ncbi:ATPase [Streptomyces sp. 8K308]|nr:AAA family ATPase [Streptomyces sp. 8K308]TDC26732.1 ATPase [Streptomyces sp. 8K308]